MSGGATWRANDRPPVLADNGMKFSYVNEHQVYIYALVDSKERCFYVGQTVAPRTRLFTHRNFERFNKHAPFRMAILDTAETFDEAASKESQWIETMRGMGHPLVNSREPIIQARRPTRIEETGLQARNFP